MPKILARPTPDALRKLYVDDGLSQRQIAKLLGIDSRTSRRWMLEAGIQMRTVSESKKGRGVPPHLVTLAVINKRRRRHAPGRTDKYRIDRNGYIYLRRPDHPDANSDGYIAEHRLLMGEHLGRPILPSEDVHHVNEIVDDNRPKNFEVLTRSEHMKRHAQWRDPRSMVRERDAVTGRFTDRRTTPR